MMSNQPRIYKLGSSKENTFVIDHVSVSPFHGEIFKDPENNVFYSDLQSQYGSYINGKKLIEPILLQPKDQLILGQNQVFDWEHVILGKVPIVSKNSSHSMGTVKSTYSGFIRENLDIILIYLAILLMLFILTIQTS